MLCALIADDETGIGEWESRCAPAFKRSIALRDGGPFSLVRLNVTEQGWGVVDANGSLVGENGLSIPLTEEEAKALIDELNCGSDDGPPTP